MIKRFLVLLLVLSMGVMFSQLLVGYSPDRQLNATAHYYATQTASETGAANIVSAIIVTYRGLDTLGEVTVLFLAAAIVGMVLSAKQGGQSPTSASEAERQLPPYPPVGELLATGTQLLVPLILMFGAYVIVNGHLTPGGGFQGGAILASGMLLLLLSDPLRTIGHRLISVVESFSGLAFVLLGILGLLLAGGFLDNKILPLGTFGSLFSAGAIPVIYIFIGLKVGAEFSSMLLNLAKTEER
ncbi:MAG: sodium:proton antiporter [Gammaproteobacteria bacterium]|nr:sodium:proton antiporter [Gammaproteobacteria bacterium]